MTISPISSNATAAAQLVQQAQGHHGHHGHGARKAGMDAAAQALGMSSTDLKTALQNGQSLSTLAQSKGVSMDTLNAAISTAVSKANPSLSADRVAQITQRLVNGPSSSSATQQPGGFAQI